MQPAPPNTIGKYQIIREIARSNDIVYEAYDPVMNRRVAIKELAVPTSSTAQQREERLRRFLREVKAAGSLAHPNIVTVYEVGEDAGRNFMAMEFLDGQTLRQLIDTNGSLGLDRALEIATDVLCGLDYAHRNGVIHRDIKPENIQILSNGTVKLTDFGIARLTFEPNITMDGQVFGTPSYMSPEQVVGKDIDVRSDLFSVGTVLYEMTSGTKPFRGDNVIAITHAILNQQPEQGQIPFGLWTVLMKALDKTPAMRFSSAQEFVQALESVRTQPVVPPPPVAPDPYAHLTLPPAAFGTPPPPQVVIPGQPYPPGYSPSCPNHQQPLPQYTQPYGFYYPPMGTPHQRATPVPVYYPPPPRQPLISPEARSVLLRMLLMLLVVGGFMALVFAAINAVSSAIQESQAAQRDAPVQRQIQQETSEQPLAERIETREEAIPNLESRTAKDAEGRQLALDHYQMAMTAETSGRYEEAEQWLDKAESADPVNPRWSYERAMFFQRARARLGSSGNATPLLQAEAVHLRNAARKAPDESSRYRMAQRSADIYLTLAQQATVAREARALFYDALEVAPPNSAQAQAAQAGLDRLNP